MIRIFILRQSRYPADTKQLKLRIKNLLAQHGVIEAQLSIALVGERKMKELAKLHLNEVPGDEVHEVLSFPASDSATSFSKGVNIRSFNPEDSSLNLGDIVICYPAARKIAIKYKRMMDDVLGELAQHGAMHLLGIHDE